MQQFLYYLENSQKSNVVDSATEEVNSYVDTIKKNYEIGGKYMTVGDLMDKFVAEAIAEKEAELAEKNATIANKDAELADRDAKLADKDAAIADKDATIADKDATIADKNAEIQKLKEEILKLKGN